MTTEAKKQKVVVVADGGGPEVDDKIKTLFLLALETVIPHLTYAHLEDLSSEFHDMLRRHMDTAQQVALFGDYKTFYDDGRLLVHDQYNEKGRLHGASLRYSGNGQLVNRRHYVDCVADGIWEEYLGTGKLLVQRRYKMGDLREYKRFNTRNGILVIDTHWLGYHRHGSYKTYDPITGRLIHDYHYANGAPHGTS